MDRNEIASLKNQIEIRCLSLCCQSPQNWLEIHQSNPTKPCKQVSIQYLGTTKIVLSFYNFAKALKLYEKAALLGHCEAQYCCGMMYLNSTGIKRSNFKKAFRYLQMASLQDNPKAQYLLAKMYYFGEGIVRNRQLGNEWMEKFNSHDARTKVIFSPPATASHLHR